jgi:transporter family protein
MSWNQKVEGCAERWAWLTAAWAFAVSTLIAFQDFHSAVCQGGLTGGAESSRLSAMNWIAWALLSAFFAGITAILAKIGVAGVDSNLATAVRTTVVLVFTWGIALATSPASSLRQLSNRTLLFLALSGIATGLSWLCYFHALQMGQASRVAPVDKLSVVFAIVLAAVVLGEKLQWQHYVGGALIVTGALILART